MVIHPLKISFDEIDGFKNQYREHCSIEKPVHPDENWILDAGRLRHRELEFFEIAVIRNEFGCRQLMLWQREPALVGLLCTTIDDEIYVLVSARCEPGLHNTCQLTSTIQSTPSNYLQRHNGSSTPFIEYFLSDVNESRILHESLQTDWGDYYLGKTKRFQIVEVDELLMVTGPQRWMRFSDLKNLLHQDYAITSDLRVALLLLHATQIDDRPTLPDNTAHMQLTELGNSWDESSTLDIQQLHQDQEKHNFLDDCGRSVVFVHFRSTSREVKEWKQPLLVFNHDKVIDVWLDTRTGDTRFAVQRGTQSGLLGIDQWFPAQLIANDQISTSSEIKKVKTSAEGGRFYRHGVNLNIRRWEDEEFDGAVEWWSRDDLIFAATNSLTASLELRMISSLIF